MKPSVRTLAAVLGAGVAMVATSALAEDPHGRDRDRYEDRDRDRGKGRDQGRDNRGRDDKGRDDRGRDDRGKNDRGRDDRRDWRGKDRGRGHHDNHHGKRHHDDRQDHHPGYRSGARYPAFKPGVHPIWSGDRWVPNFRGLKRGQRCKEIRYRAPFRGRPAVFAATQCFNPYRGAYVVPGSQVFVGFARHGGRW